MKRVSEVAPAEKVSPAWLKPAEIEGVELVLRGFETREGQYGDYVVIAATRGDEDEVIHIATGSETVMEQLAYVAEASAFPVQARFVRAGRRWLLE